MKYVLLLCTLLPATLFAQKVYHPWEIGISQSYIEEGTRGSFVLETTPVVMRHNLHPKSATTSVPSGLFVRYTQGRLGFQAEALHWTTHYTTILFETVTINYPNGQTQEIQTTPHHIRLVRVLSVPLTLRWKPFVNTGKGLRLIGGLGVDFLFPKEVNSDLHDDRRYRHDPEQNPFQPAFRAYSRSFRTVVPTYHLGVGYDLGQFSLDARYQRTIGSMHRPFTHAGADYHPQRMRHVYSLGLSYRLRFRDRAAEPPAAPRTEQAPPPAPETPFYREDSDPEATAQRYAASGPVPRHSLRTEVGGGFAAYLPGFYVGGEYRYRLADRWAIGAGANYLSCPGYGGRTQTTSLSERATTYAGELTVYRAIGDVHKLHAEVGLGMYGRQVTWEYWTGPNTYILHLAGPNSYVDIPENDLGVTVSVGMASPLPLTAHWAGRTTTSVRYVGQVGTYGDFFHTLRLGVSFHF